MAEKVGKEYCSPEILFQDYMEAWVGLSIKKAKLYLRRLASQARKDEIDNIHSQSRHRHPSRQISEEDLINQQLQTFNFIHESCWTTFDDLPFSSQELEVKCSIQLIQGFNILESRFITEKTNMYLEDEVLDADEMMKLIKLLDGLRERYLVAGDRLHLLYSNSQLEKDKEKIAETFPTLENMKRMLNEQIQARMENYAHSHSAKFRVNVSYLLFFYSILTWEPSVTQGTLATPAVYPHLVFNYDFAFSPVKVDPLNSISNQAKNFQI